MTITECGNPALYTGKRGDLLLRQVKEMIERVRKSDDEKAFASAADNQLNATPLTVAPTVGTATDRATLTTNGTVNWFWLHNTSDRAIAKRHSRMLITPPQALGDECEHQHIERNAFSFGACS